MLEKHIDGGQSDTHFSGTEQGFEVFDLLVNELKKTDALTGYHTDTHTPVHTADILYNILHIYIHIQIQVIHHWIQNSALQLRRGLTVNRLLNMSTYGF